MIMQTIFRMYAVRRWDEERVIQGLAVLMCLVLLGMTVIPTVTTDLIAHYLETGEVHIDGLMVVDFAHAAIYGIAIGAAVGGLAGAGIGLLWFVIIASPSIAH
jgi:hypothetical protein